MGLQIGCWEILAFDPHTLLLPGGQLAYFGGDFRHLALAGVNAGTPSNSSTDGQFTLSRTISPPKRLAKGRAQLHAVLSTRADGRKISMNRQAQP